MNFLHTKQSYQKVWGNLFNSRYKSMLVCSQNKNTNYIWGCWVKEALNYSLWVGGSTNKLSVTVQLNIFLSLFPYWVIPILGKKYFLGKTLKSFCSFKILSFLYFEWAGPTAAKVMLLIKCRQLICVFPQWECFLIVSFIC